MRMQSDSVINHGYRKIYFYNEQKYVFFWSHEKSLQIIPVKKCISDLPRSEFLFNTFNCIIL